MKKNKALVYNTISGAKLEYGHPVVIRLLKKALKNENLQVIELNTKDLENPVIRQFVEDMKDRFMGDTSSASLSNGKPFQLVPTPGIQSDIKRMKRDPFKVAKSIMTFLSDLTLYINNYSNGNQDVHSLFSMKLKLYKQFLFPYMDEKGGKVELPVKEVEKILNELKESGLCMLRITGGNIFDHSEFNALLKRLEMRPVTKIFYVHYLDAADCLHKAQTIAETGSKIVLSVTFPVIEDKFADAVRFAGSSPGVSFTFAVANERDLEACEGLISRYNLENVRLDPYYNGENLDFFESVVFIGEDNIRGAHPTQKEILNRMEINSNAFGKLTIMSAGDIYANLNAPGLGNIKNKTIRDAIYRELFHGKNWMKTRPGVKPCNGCLYNLLCPPVSNYEYVLGRNNLCHIH
jgi:pseudo-rSAM protein